LRNRFLNSLSLLFRRSFSFPFYTVKSYTFLNEAIGIFKNLDETDTDQCADAYRELGRSQLFNGDSESALVSLQKCLDLREGIHGCDSEKWAEIAYDVGIAKFDSGHYDDAADLLEQYVRLQNTFEKADTVGLSNALLHLGKLSIKRRDPDDGLKLFEEALSLRRELEDNELAVSEVLSEIGMVRDSKKQYQESLACYEESLALRQSGTGEDEETADLISRIGELRRMKGQFDVAMENLSSAIEMYKRTVGETHLSVASTYHSLGYVYDAKDDQKMAMKCHRDGLSVRKILLGGNHVKIASSLDDVAGVYQKQQDHEKALKCLREALRIRKLNLGNDDMEIAKTLFGMGIIFAAIDDNGKAMECYLASIEISAADGTNPKLQAQTLHQIGCVYAAKCNYREALKNWRTCLSKYRESGLSDDNYMVACTLGNIEMAESALFSPT